MSHSKFVKKIFKLAASKHGVIFDDDRSFIGLVNIQILLLILMIRSKSVGFVKPNVAFIVVLDLLYNYKMVENNVLDVFEYYCLRRHISLVRKYDHTYLE